MNGLNNSRERVMAVAALIRLLKKIIVGPIDWFLYTVIREEQKRFLANLLSEKQKNALKKITQFGKNYTQKQTINNIKYYLYNLGLTKKGLEELKTLYHETKDPMF